jgi:ElaB/YqjD/DUF883 family membrane-anchored ribosome-binding protein
MTDQFAYASEEARQARNAVNDAAEHGQRSLNDALGAAERAIATAARSAERMLKDSIDALRDQTSAYTDEARRHLDDGQRFVVAQVNQRPMTATLAGLGVGLLLGLLLSSRSK